MTMQMIEKVTIIGAGNLATQLGLELGSHGIGIQQVYSRTEASAKALALQLGCPFTTSTGEIVPGADLYIFALSDRALSTVLEEIEIPRGKFVHTAGSVPMDVFEPYTDRFGVFYPLQTFSKERKANFLNIPICVEANHKGLEHELVELGEKISKNVHLVTSEQRRQLHLAAVFACNFANHMFSIGQELLREKNIDFKLLEPLILETAQKALDMGPLSAQTGPAARHDKEIIAAHEKALESFPDFQKMYRFVSESIFRTH